MVLIPVRVDVVVVGAIRSARLIARRLSRRARDVLRTRLPLTETAAD